MKHTGKRALSALLSLSLMIGLFAGVTLPASAAENLPATGGELLEGEYVLTNNITLTNNLVINSAVTIDLRTYTLTGTGTGSVITVSSGGNLTLKGSGKITGGKIASETLIAWKLGAGVTVDGGTFIMNGGAISGNVTEEGGAAGGVNVANGGTFTMNGGSISQNIGIGLNVTGATATINTGASISGNETLTDGSGAGVHVIGNGTVTLAGGTISGNTADVDGGGVYVASAGTLIMQSGTISGNNANNGAGVYVSENGTFTMSNGEIKNNTATENGGGVNVSSGSPSANFTLSGGSIKENNAAQGGGVYQHGMMSVSGAPSITGNTLSGGMTINNIHLFSDNQVLTNTGLSNGAVIGVTAGTLPEGDNSVTVLTGYGSNAVSYLSSDAEGYVLEVDEQNNVVLKAEQQTDPGTGEPEDPPAATGVTRADLALLIYNKFMPAGTGTSSFTDIGSCTAEQQKAINALAGAGIISGTDTNTFSPDDTVTYEAAAYVIGTAAGADSTQTVESLQNMGIVTESVTDTDTAQQATVEAWLGNITTRAEMAVLIYNEFQPTDTSAGTPNFTDIGGCTTEQQNAINALAAAGILNGKKPNLFKPAGIATRVEVAAVIYKALGGGTDAPEQTIFNDITDEWSKPAINYLVEQGILTTEDRLESDLFKPGNAVQASTISTWLGRASETPVVSGMTRVQAAVLVYNKFKNSLDSTGSVPAYTDIDNCTAEQQEAIKALAAAGVILGTSDGRYNPDQVVTRFEAAVILYRAMGGSEVTGVDRVFNDLGPQQEAYVNYLVAQGVLSLNDAFNVEGAEGEFRPNDTIAQETFSTWLLRVPSTITFDANGGRVSPSSAQTVNGQLSSLPTPTRSGSYSFDGWYTAGSGGSKVTTATVFAQDTVIYAHWTYTGGSSSGGSSSGGSSSGSSSSGSSSSGSTTTTEPDTGTTVETKEDGTVVTTEKKEDGSTVQTVQNPDGSSEVSTELADGTTTTVTTTQDGHVEADVKLPGSVTVEAASNGGVITLPIPEVRPTLSTVSAPVVSVDLGSNMAATVEIPVAAPTMGTVAVIVNPDGTETVVQKSIITENGVALTVEGGATVKIVDNSKTFSDVSAGTHWASDAVDFVSARELFNGTSATTFSPEEPMTRAMLTTVLARLEGVDTSAGSTWYEVGRQWAMEQGISDGSNMDGNISRQDLATMLYRYVGSPAVSGSLDSFPDAANVSDYAADAMRWAVENGIIQGTDGGRLDPGSSAKRSEVATILMRFCNNLI